MKLLNLAAKGGVREGVTFLNPPSPLHKGETVKLCLASSPLIMGGSIKLPLAFPAEGEDWEGGFN